MYLVERRKLLYAQVVNGQQTLFLWIFEFHFFSHLYTYFELKSVAKMWQEERVGGYGGRNGMIFCMLYPWQRLFSE